MYQNPKGLRDILPPETSLWQSVETTARQILHLYNFKEIRTPVMEFTEVFTRSIGEDTDIVEKEMYTFSDRAGRSLTLRPEGTASVVRAFVQHALFQKAGPHRFYYIGPMFRYERPQKGRYRQFHQIGAEVFGDPGPRIDAEVLDMLHLFFKRLGLQGLKVQLNSLGCNECRPLYREALLKSLSSTVGSLCGDCQRRYHRNPLRVLDCKVPSCQSALEDIPRMIDYLCESCRAHLDGLMADLQLLGLEYEINHRMVRGLDYYTRTVFEVNAEGLGAQNAVAAGGRYDNLVKEFGGPDTPAIGFAIGMERLTMLLSEEPPLQVPLGYFITMGEEAQKEAFVMASEARRQGFALEVDYSGRSVKAQFRRADSSGARYAFIIGEDELRQEVIKYKRLSDGTQGVVPKAEFINFLRSL